MSEGSDLVVRGLCRMADDVLTRIQRLLAKARRLVSRPSKGHGVYKLDPPKMSRSRRASLDQAKATARQERGTE